MPTRPTKPPVASKPSIQLPSTGKPGATRPAPPIAGKPGGSGKPGIAGKPGIDRPGTGKPGVEKPSIRPGDLTKPAPKPGPGGGPGIATRPSFPSLGDRPNIGDRPGIGGGPGGLDRPGGRPGIGDGPGGFRPGDRPGDRPGIADRPGIGDRPGQGDRPIIGGNRPGFGGGNQIGDNNINIGNNVNINRPGWGIDPGFTHPGGNWNNHWHDHYVHHHHHGWYHGCWHGHWNNWYAPVVFGATAWGLGAWTASWGYGSGYVNPYYVPVAQPAYDYSQPVVVNNYVNADADASGGQAESTAQAEASPSLQMFDAALAAFKEGDYASALSRCDNALKESPKDPVIHEVRALCLFALGKYQEAAATLNSLLAVSPGMDWTTMSGLYGDADAYTKQLRALESHLKANPKDPAGQFVLAYHYLVLGEADAAADALKVVVAQQPKDATAKRMLEGITGGAATAEEPVKPKPSGDDGAAPETDLVGIWQAKAGKTTVELWIDTDFGFVWKATTPGADPQEIVGKVEATGDSLSLVSGKEDQGTMAGSVKSGGPDKFTWKLAGSPASDPGLEFTRKK